MFTPVIIEYYLSSLAVGHTEVSIEDIRNSETDL